jgi:hypothetical protein
MSGENKLPGWALTIGILGSVAGLAGILAASIVLYTGAVLKAAPELTDAFSQSIEQLEQSDVYGDPDEETVNPWTGKAEVRENTNDQAGDQTRDSSVPFETIKGVLQIPWWYGTWEIANGILALILGAGYLIASIFLLSLRSFAPRLFIVVILLSIVRNLFSIALGAVASIYWAMFTILVSICGLAVDLVFLIVLKVSDKSAFLSSAGPPGSRQRVSPGSVD